MNRSRADAADGQTSPSAVGPWIVWAVVVWNVVFDRVLVEAGREYVADRDGRRGRTRSLRAHRRHHAAGRAARRGARDRGRRCHCGGWARGLPAGGPAYFSRTSSKNLSARGSFDCPSQNIACFRTAAFLLFRATSISFGTPSSLGSWLRAKTARRLTSVSGSRSMASAIVAAASVPGALREPEQGVGPHSRDRDGRARWHERPRGGGSLVHREGDHRRPARRGRSVRRPREWC